MRIFEPDPPAFMDIQDVDIQEIINDPCIMHIACMFMRPGSSMFARKLEIEHYRPGTPANDLYNITIEKSFPKKRNESDPVIPWMVIHLPLTDFDKANDTAEKTGMRLNHGYPCCFSEAGEERFFINHKRVWTLESGRGSFIYSGELGRERIKEIEDEVIKKLDFEHESWILQQDRIWIEGIWWNRAGEDDPSLKTAKRAFKKEYAGQEVIWWTNE